MSRPTPKYAKQVMVRLTDEQYDQLETESRSTNVATVEIIRDAIRQRYEAKGNGTTKGSGDNG